MTIDFVNDCILTGSSDTAIRIFELERRDAFASQTLRGHTDEVRGIIHLKERNQVACNDFSFSIYFKYVSVAWDNSIRIWKDMHKTGTTLPLIYNWY